MGKITDLLLKLQNKNKLDRDNEQIINHPERGFTHIFTLDGRSRKMSPMLRERFEFAAKWEDAFLLQTWLSLDEINHFDENECLIELVNLRVENWDDVPPKSIGFSNTTIFGYDPNGTNETYLEWIKGEVEPRVWCFIDANFHMFDNLEVFLKYTCDEFDDE